MPRMAAAMCWTLAWIAQCLACTRMQTCVFSCTPTPKHAFITTGANDDIEFKIMYGVWPYGVWRMAYGVWRMAVWLCGVWLELTAERNKQ